MQEFFLTFMFIIVAALPGRTTFILILLTASVRPWRILAGAIPAFVLQCLVAVLCGQKLRELPHEFIQLGAGALFLFFSFRFWRESRKSESLDYKKGRSIFSVFILFLVAELGDVSQLAIAARAAQTADTWSVFAGSVAAMSVIAIVAAFAGRLFSSMIKPSTLQKSASIFFLVLGVYLLVTA